MTDPSARVSACLNEQQSPLMLIPYALREPDPTLAQPVNALCLTLYNESLQELQATLLSAADSLKQYHNLASSEGDLSAICIIVDGIAAMRPEITGALVRWGLLADHSSVDAEGTHTYSTLLDTDELLERLRPDLPIRSSAARSQIAVFVTIKGVNRGKLHSHKLFFSRLCPALNPTYCYQIDAGTIVDEQLIGLVAEQMRQRPEVAGIAPRITPAVPMVADSFLAKWQFFDFAFRACVEWPFEVLTGYLSVLPGQVCAFRWKALHGDGSARASSCGPRSPIRAYLEGMETTNAADRIRYLAEDRVIGTQLMFSAQRPWRLSYMPQAIGTTDRCTSLVELLRQRRRWNNSALVTRYWLLQQLPELMRRKDRTVAQKAALFASAVGQLLIACRDFSGPAVLGALLTVLVWQASTVSMTWERVAYIAYFAIAALDVALNTYSLVISGKRAPPAWLAPGLNALDYLCPVVFVVAVLSFSWPVALLLIVPALGLIPSALLLPGRSFGTMLRQQLSPITMLAMSCGISLYAFLRLHDVSWGTKGLTRADVRDSLQQDLRRMRNRMLRWWMLGNAALLATALATQGIVGQLNILTATICALEGLLAISGLSYAMTYGRRS